MNLDEIKKIAEQFIEKKRGSTYRLSDIFVDEINCAVFYAEPREQKIINSSSDSELDNIDFSNVPILVSKLDGRLFELSNAATIEFYISNFNENNDPFILSKENIRLDEERDKENIEKGYLSQKEIDELLG